MHHIYWTFATDTARDRIREAAMWRLADEARRTGLPSVEATFGGIRVRVRALLARSIRQPLLPPSVTPDVCQRG